MDGVLLVDKPAGPTSFDIVAAVRRTLPKGTKVGHSGTLDPFATGLLLILLGRATRVQRFLMELPKAYDTVARLGWTSSTGDPEGELVHTGRIPPDPPPLPTGTILQRPPAYSAIKIGGKRAYALARAGETVEIPEREVHVSRFEQTWRDDDRAAFSIGCSSGTYVRTLIADLGDAYCLELRRTAIGPFSVDDAVGPPGQDVARGTDLHPLPLARALQGVLPSAKIAEEHVARAVHGSAIPLGEPAEGHVLLVDAAGDAVCLAEVRDGLAKPRVGFRA
jgi:tRNA pseudouridine55 synthase